MNCIVSYPCHITLEKLNMYITVKRYGMIANKKTLDKKQKQRGS